MKLKLKTRLKCGGKLHDQGTIIDSEEYNLDPYGPGHERNWDILEEKKGLKPKSSKKAKKDK